MEGHKILHLIGPIFIIIGCVRIFKMRLLSAVILTFLLGLGKEIYDFFVPKDALSMCVLDVLRNIVGIILAVLLNQLIGFFTPPPHDN